MEHQIELCSIREDIGEENTTHENSKENKRDQNQCVTLRDVGEDDTIDPKLKEDITHARIRKRKEIARERIAKRLLPQSKITGSTKNV